MSVASLVLSATKEERCSPKTVCVRAERIERDLEHGCSYSASSHFLSYKDLFIIIFPPLRIPRPKRGLPPAAVSSDSGYVSSYRRQKQKAIRF